jgi:hypothetical protein
MAGLRLSRWGSGKGGRVTEMRYRLEGTTIESEPQSIPALKAVVY